MNVIRWNLDPYDDEFINIVELFEAHNTTNKDILYVESIEKVYNHALRSRFAQKKTEYLRRYGEVKEVQLFHGTPKCNIQSILETNLEVRRHGRNVGHRFGAGVSFSALASYASHYCGTDNQMLLCSVLISNIVEVPEIKERHSTLIQPPYIPGKYPSLRCDTTAKNSLTMDVIVKFEDDSFYPEYIIFFKKEPKRAQLSIGLRQSDLLDDHNPRDNYRTSNMPLPILARSSGLRIASANQFPPLSNQRMQQPSKCTSSASYAQTLRGKDYRPRSRLSKERRSSKPTQPRTQPTHTHAEYNSYHNPHSYTQPTHTHAEYNSYHNPYSYTQPTHTRNHNAEYNSYQNPYPYRYSSSQWRPDASSDPHGGGGGRGIILAVILGILCFVLKRWLLK